MKLIRGVQINPDGIDIQYMGETDVRAEGAVYQTHTISIARDGSLDDELREFEEAADALLTAAISAWAKSLPIDLSANERLHADLDDDDDDDPEGGR